MSGRGESGSADQQSDAQGSSSQSMASSRYPEGYRMSPLHDQRSMMNPMQEMASSPPGGMGRHDLAGPPQMHYQVPAMRRIVQHVTTATAATAVTPDSRQFAPPEIMSPPYSTIRRRESSPGSGPTIMSVSPTKRSGRSGEPLFRRLSVFSVPVFVL